MKVLIECSVPEGSGLSAEDLLKVLIEQNLQCLLQDECLGAAATGFYDNDYLYDAGGEEIGTLKIKVDR